MNIKDLLKDAYKEGMTLEEIESALEGIELPADNSAEIERLKNALSKSNSEAADYKKQLRDKMTDDEKKAKEDAEKLEQLQKSYNELLKEKNISSYKSELLALGYEDKLASETAEAMVNGDTAKVFANQKKHQEAVAQKIRSDILKDTPKPDGGNGSGTMTIEKLKEMSVEERLKFSEEHPDEYKQLYGGNG
jgi:hypothetical protein